uniref:Uncharacterized protein n=1 Tax=Nelumbo nucifera TaxID=4432 RepID=A0A822ZAE0_NELNU|nr:TPA_asm: hypothetical protein HUJ06_000302 [Nelumbo nucifera]
MAMELSLWRLETSLNCNLHYLSLRQNQFSGGIPSSILNSRELQVLDLRNNSLSMEFPIDIGELSDLSTLALSRNQLTGGIPSLIQKLGRLETLQFNNNRLSGVIPPWLFDIKGPNEFHLGGNSLTWKSGITVEIVFEILVELLAASRLGFYSNKS